MIKTFILATAVGVTAISTAAAQADTTVYQTTRDNTDESATTPELALLPVPQRVLSLVVRSVPLSARRSGPRGAIS